MGYDLDCFTGHANISQELVCAICFGVMKDPVMVDKCQHMFCEECIRDCHRATQTCPMDRQRVGKSQLKPAPRPIQNIINELYRKCRFNGCAENFRLGQTAAHEALCEANPDFMHSCRNECGAKLKAADVETHNCIVYLKQLSRTQNADLVTKLAKSETEIAQLRKKLKKAEDARKVVEARIKTAEQNIRQVRAMSPNARIPVEILDLLFHP